MPQDAATDLGIQASPLNLADYEAAAQRVLSPFSWDFYAGGAGEELTVADNLEAFRRIRLRPRLLQDVATRNLTTTVLGVEVSLPVLIAPTTAQTLAHPEGELAVARAAAAVGTVMGCSTYTHFRIDEIAAVSSAQLWYQLYPAHNRAVTECMVRRAEEAGCRAIVFTADASYPRRWGLRLREPFDWPAECSPGNLERVTWDIPVPGTWDDFAEYPLVWSDLAWLREATSLPFVLKGVLTAEDARLAVEHGCDGVVVSNHGGRSLDGTLSSIDALPEIVDAAAGQMEIFLDGGIRRGSDAIKALALGARAVLIGRPFLWGLAVGGEAGVRHVLEILRDEIAGDLAMLGRADVRALDRSVVATGAPLPPSFRPSLPDG